MKIQFNSFLRTKIFKVLFGLFIFVVIIELSDIGISPTIKINENRVHNVNEIYDKIKKYNEIYGIYPANKNGLEFSKIFNSPLSLVIYYKVSPDGKQFIVGHKLAHDNLIVNRMKNHSGVLYKNFYYDTILPRGSIYNDFYFETSGDYFTLSKIKEIYSHLEER